MESCGGRKVNTVSISGYVQGDTELRNISDGRQILNFVVAVEGDGEPYVRCGYLLGRGEVLQIKAGERVFIEGRLKGHRVQGLFLAAKIVRVLNVPMNGEETRPEAANGA